MLGVGWTEMLVIGVVALIVIGPKELPALMHRIGKFAGTIRRMGSDFQRELNKTTGLNEITNLRNSVTQPLKATADAIRKEFNTTTASGTVVPSGVIKPADPKAESVVNEIKAAAGMAPAMTPLATTTAAAVAAPVAAAAAPVKARRPGKVAAPAPSRVAVADIPPAAKPARVKKPIESPTAVEATAPARPARARTAAKPDATPVAATKSPVAKAAAAKPASPAAKPAAAVRKPAAKSSAGEKN